jgi:hypothetical protein
MNMDLYVSCTTKVRCASEHYFSDCHVSLHAEYRMSTDISSRPNILRIHVSEADW